MLSFAESAAEGPRRPVERRTMLLAAASAGRVRHSRMGVNLDKPERWKADIARSVDAYNEWFLRFAPKAYRDSRAETAREVEATLKATDSLRNVGPQIVRANPGALRVLRMSTCPPLARDRLSGLSAVSRTLVNRLDKERKLPARMTIANLDAELGKLGGVIERLADHDLCPWLERRSEPTFDELQRAATVIADRLCGATADPIIRNAQAIVLVLTVSADCANVRTCRH